MPNRQHGRISPRLKHLKNPIHFVTLGFGSGLATNAPGSVGSGIALICYASFLAHLSPIIYLLFLACGLILGIWLCEYSGKALRDKDHPAIVWDEFIGMWTALIAVPNEWEWLLTAFVLFRLLDIFKPPPLRSLENLPGGVGVMMDDFVAGLIAATILFLLRYGLGM